MISLNLVSAPISSLRFGAQQRQIWSTATSGATTQQEMVLTHCPIRIALLVEDDLLTRSGKAIEGTPRFGSTRS